MASCAMCYLPLAICFQQQALVPQPLPMEEWLLWMSNQGLHTYLNDHPFPVGQATTPKETAFRYSSLTSFLSRGVSVNAVANSLFF